MASKWCGLYWNPGSPRTELVLIIIMLYILSWYFSGQHSCLLSAITPALIPSAIWNALRGVAMYEAWKWKRHPRSCLSGSLQILQLLWRKLHSHREHVRLEENYDKRSPKGPLKLGSYFFPQAESQFPKSKNETKYIFIKYYFDITPLCMTGQALPLSLWIIFKHSWTLAWRPSFETNLPPWTY